MSSPVYPRRCGEHASSEVSPVGVLGLSPQVRGTRLPGKIQNTSQRFIPAGAGNTSYCSASAVTSAVYPRRCGEHELLHRQAQPDGGLSPQVRGTLGCAVVDAPEVRFIPAGAGNTWSASGGPNPCPVYPRRCGEHCHGMPLQTITSGLSPQVRGTPDCHWHYAGDYRFIPAGAGNTGGENLLPVLFAVYPRRCGEHLGAHGPGRRQRGLSPQVRGTRQRQLAHGANPRFIPAGAGNTSRSRAGGPRRSVYPRRCGEHTRSSSAMRSRAGLSPQVRGTRSIHSGNSIPKRFIPAGAGNTVTPPLCLMSETVYPRRCGEHVGFQGLQSGGDGLSPQGRGTPDSIKPGENWHRFIPAGAGNTLRVPRRCTEAPVYPRRCGEHMEGDFGPWLYFGLSPQVRGTRGLAALANA